MEACITSGTQDLTERNVLKPLPRSWSIESSALAKRNIVVLVLRLLEALGLPECVEALEDVRFVYPCGGPRYKGHFDFEGPVGTSGLAVTPTAKLVFF